MARSTGRLRLPLIVAVVIVSLAIATIVVTRRSHELGSAARDVGDPIARGAADVVRPIGSFFANAVHYGSVQKENEQLEYLLGQLRLQQAETPYERNQLRLLESLQSIPFVHASTVIAETIDETSNGFGATITLDKGSGDGVQEGFAVVGRFGLVGEVTAVTKHTCIVRLVTDGQSRIAVSFGTSGQNNAVVIGQGPGVGLNADFVATNVPIKVGEQLVTSQLPATSFPPNIPVGTVSAFRTPPGASQRTVAVTPSLKLNDLLYVAVVQWSPS